MTENYSLRRIGDNAGQDGRYSYCIAWNEDGTFTQYVGERPKVGCSMTVLMGISTYWLTTIVTEILEDTPDMVRFKTLNSEYIWRKNTKNSDLQSSLTESSKTEA